MKSRIGRIGITFSVVALLGGCATAPQKPIQFTPTTITSPTHHVGVAMATLPEVNTYLPGANCLLCIAVASAANSTLTSYTRTLPYEDLPQLKNKLAELLRKNGTKVTVIEETLKVETFPDFTAKGANTARKDFSSLKKKYDIDKLVVINISQLGFIRTYSAYIPTSEPKGMLQGVGYMVNLNTNVYEWYMPVDITKSTDAKWDEPPKFPGLTNAYFQTIEMGKDAFLAPFNK